MNRKLYWKQQFPLLSLNFLCMIVLAFFLRINGNSLDGIILILFVWGLILAGYLLKSYFGRKVQMEKLLRLTE